MMLLPYSILVIEKLTVAGSSAYGSVDEEEE